MEANEIAEIKNEVKILKDLQSDYILRYYEDYEDSDYYLIFTEICVIINHKAEDKRNLLTEYSKGSKFGKRDKSKRKNRRKSSD